jgi:nicotinic acid phosphoribosyltransferase
MVYKICFLKGIPRIKISEESAKTTIPGKKNVIRAFLKEKPVFDVLCLDSETATFCN